MLRRLLNVAAVLSLVVAALLVAGIAGYPPGQVWEFGSPDRGWSVLVGNGKLGIGHGTALVAMVGLGQAAVPFALFPLVWFAAVVRRERRQRASGFPVEVRHAQTVQPPADRGTEATAEDTAETASDEPDYPGGNAGADRGA